MLTSCDPTTSKVDADGYPLCRASALITDREHSDKASDEYKNLPIHCAPFCLSDLSINKVQAHSKMPTAPVEVLTRFCEKPAAIALSER